MSFSSFSTPQQQPFLQPQQRPPPPQQPLFQPQQWRQPFFQPQQPPRPQQPYFQPQQWQQHQPFFQPQQWQQQQPFFQPQQPPPLQQPYFQPQQPPPPQQPFFQPQQWRQQRPFFQPQQPPPLQQPYFQPQQWQQQQQPFFQPQQTPLPQLLFIKDGTPATDNTKWEDLHPQSQNFILQIEERVVMYRNESERLDQWSRLYEYSVSNDGFKFDASHIKQVLDGISVAMERPWNLKQELTSSVAIMSRDTQMAVSNFNRLTDVSGERGIGPGLPKRPSSFLWETVSRFEKHLGECRRWIEELERLLRNSERHTSSNGSFSWQFLHEVMANVHDFFIRVAAKVESGIHQRMDDVRSTDRVKHRRRQEKYDPFRVADQRDAARKEGSSKRLRPTFHSPEVSQPSTELAGLFYSSGTVRASTAPQASPLTSNSLGSGLSVISMPFLVPSISSAPQTSPLTSNSSGSGLSFFSTPYSVPSSSVAPQTSPQTSNSSGSGFSFFSMPYSVPSSSAASQTYPLTSNSSGSGLSFFSTSYSVPSSSVAPQTSPLTSNSSGSDFSFFSMPYSVPSSSAASQTYPLTSNSSGIDLSDFSMPYSVPFSSAVPQTYPITSKSSGSGLSVFGMPSSVPSSSVPALYTTPTTSAQEFTLSGSSSGTSCPERVLEVVHQASMESSIPSARTQTSPVYSISGTFEAPTGTQISYRRGRFTVCGVIPSATSQVSLLNSSSSSLFGSTPSQFGGTAPSRGTTSGGSNSSSLSFSPEIMTPSATSQASLLNSSSSSLFGSTPSQLGGTAPSRSTTSGASISASPSFSPGPATGTASTSPLKRPRSRTNLSQGDSSDPSE